MTETLKQRIITASALIIAALIFILIFSTPWFAVASLVLVVTIGGLEWADLISLDSFRKGLYVAGMLLLSYLSYISSEISWIFVTIGFFWLLANIVFLIKYKKDSLFYTATPELNNSTSEAIEKNFRSIYLNVSGYFVILSAWSAAVILHSQSPYLLLLIVFLVAAADSGAYFAGKKFGKNKVAVNLSPGKTWEGVLGGVIAAFVLTIIGGALLGVSGSQFGGLLFLAVICALVSVVGDLFISLLKREAGVKDSGQILPGHGGVLDRVDGLIAALPIFALGLHWLAI